MCVGFLQIYDSKLPSLIVISVSENGSDFRDFSAVKAIIECCSFKRFKNLEQSCSSSKIANISSTYLKYKAGEDFDLFFKRTVSKCARKKLAIVGPNKGDPIASPSIAGGTGGAAGALAPPLFSGGGWGGLIYAFISTILPLHECI